MTKKKKSSDDPPKDPHKSKKMFRITDQIHAQYRKLADRNDRPMAREIRSALIKNLRENGLWPPEEGEDENENTK